jgi:F0F1-type ATP synthase membrane subunit b/b'
MDLLASLNIDQTLIFHFVIFAFVYLFLYFLLFKPYYKAFSERVKRTSGTQDVAERIVAETLDLETTYETKARKMSIEFKSLYDESRTKAMEEYDKTVSEARAQAKALLEKNRVVIQSEIEEAKKGLALETASVSQAIVRKILGKEVHP